MADKERKIAEFRAKTATTAQQRLKKQKEDQRREAELKKAADRERLLKTKEFAAKQREKAAKKANEKRAKAAEDAKAVEEPNPNALKRTHAVRPGIRKLSPPARAGGNSTI